MVGCAKQYTANAELLDWRLESLLVHSLPIWGHGEKPSEDSPVFLRSPCVSSWEENSSALAPLLLLLLVGALFWILGHSVSFIRRSDLDHFQIAVTRRIEIPISTDE